MTIMERQCGQISQGASPPASTSRDNRQPLPPYVCKLGEPTVEKGSVALIYNRLLRGCYLGSGRSIPLFVVPQIKHNF
jgi:hypothetical protein